MRWLRNAKAALQMVLATPWRTLILALPVAAALALTLATLAINQGVNAKAQEAIRNRGADLIVVSGGSRIGALRSETTLTMADVAALQSRLPRRDVTIILPTYRNEKTPARSEGAKSREYKVFGVSPPWFVARDFPAENGKVLDDFDAVANVCVIGQTVKRELFGDQDPLGQNIHINESLFTVKGVLVSRGASPAEGDRDARIVIPFGAFERLFRPIHLGQIVIQVADPTAENVQRIAEQVRTTLRREHRLAESQPEDFVVRTPESIGEESRLLSRSVFYLLLGLAGVLALTAAVVLGVVFHQGVRARRGEFGLRRALGAEPGDILQQVWAEGWLISLIGGIVGFGLGLAAAWAVGQRRELPFAFDGLVLLAPLAAVALASLAGLPPARQAAALDPAQALRQ